MANEIDAHVGMRLRQRRWMLGLTQQQLGDRVGIKFQQIQKYETGQNRISASRLWALAQVCEAPVGYFFEGLAPDAPELDDDAPEAEGRAPASQGDPLADREAAELLRAYYAATPPRRRAAFELMRVLADQPAIANPGGGSVERGVRAEAAPLRGPAPTPPARNAAAQGALSTRIAQGR